MNRLGRVVCCAVFLFVGAISPAFALTPLSQPSVFNPIIIADVASGEFQTAFGEHRLELIGTTSTSALSFDGTTASSLFTTVSISDASFSDEASAAEWDHLWRSSSQIPITSVPEPTTSSLLVGCGIILWARRTRQWIK